MAGGETGEDRLIPGNAATVQADSPFRGLAMFGANFLSKFQVSKVASSSLLDALTLVDTPGVLAGDKQRLGRAYDFPAVVKWFAERADMIMIFFDAHKLDISDELKQILATLAEHDDKIRIVLNKSDQVTRQELMHVYGALMWSLSKAIATPEVPRVFVTAFRSCRLEASDLSGLIAEEHCDLLRELAQLPTNSATRKVNDIVKRARLARVHALLVDHLRAQMPALFGKSSKQSRLLDNLDAELRAIQNRYAIPPGDFPSKEYFLERMRQQSLDAFPKLSTRQLTAIETALAQDIPNLMRTLSIQTATHRPEANIAPISASSSSSSSPSSSATASADAISSQMIRLASPSKGS